MVSFQLTRPRDHCYLFSSLMWKEPQAEGRSKLLPCPSITQSHNCLSSLQQMFAFGFNSGLNVVKVVIFSTSLETCSVLLTPYISCKVPLHFSSPGGCDLCALFPVRRVVVACVNYVSSLSSLVTAAVCTFSHAYLLFNFSLFYLEILWSIFKVLLFSKLRP